MSQCESLGSAGAASPVELPGRLRKTQWILLAMFLVVSVCLSAGGYWYWRHEVQSIRSEKYNNLKAISELKVRQIVAWREERLVDARFNSTRKLLRNAIVGWVQAPTDASRKSAIREALSPLQDHYGYDNVILAGADSRFFLSLDPRLTAPESRTQSLVKQAISSREAVFGDLFLCPICNRIHLDVAAPVFDASDNAVAVLILRSDPEQHLYPLIQSWPTPSPSAETLLVRRAGEDVLFLNELRHRRDVAMKLHEPLSRADLPAAMAALGHVGEFEGRDYRGVKVLADVRPVPGSPWFMVAKVDVREILAEARHQGYHVLTLVGVSILASALMAAFSFDRRERSLYRNYRTIFDVANDAHFIHDQTTGEILDVNEATCKLLEYSREDLRHMTIEDVSLGKPPYSQKEVVQWVRRAATQGPQRFEWLCKARSGKLIWVEVTLKAASIGGCARVIAVARDISERKQSESHIARQSAVLKAVNRVFSQAMTCTSDADVAKMCLQVAEELTGSRFGFIGEINAAGRYDVMALSDPGWQACTLPEPHAGRLLKNMEIRGIWGQVMLDGASRIVNDPASAPERVGTPEGHPVLTAFLGVPLVRGGRTFGMIAVANKEGGYDDADRHALEDLAVPFVEALLSKRAELSLARSEEEYRTLFREMLGGCCRCEVICDAQGRPVDSRFLAINPAFEHLTGLKSEEVLGRTILELFPFLDPSWIETLGKVALTGEPAHFEKAAEPGVWREVIAFRSAPNQYACIFTDISDRIKARDDLATRARIANVFLTVQDEEMYNGVLNVVLDVLHSPFGVFGYLDEDGSLVVPTMTRQVWDKCQVARKTIRFPRETWTDSSWPRAIREKRVVWSNEPSRNVPEGHVSIQRHISLPILFQDEVVGLFQVANSAREYSEADIQTLQSIAEHVAPLLVTRLGRERAVARLRASEQRHRVILMAAMDGFWLADMQGRLLEVNDAYCRMSGYTRSELLGMRIADLEAIETAAETIARLQRIKAQGEDRFESKQRRKDKTVFDVDVSVQYRDEGGGQVVVFLRDITDRKKAEEQLRALNEQLEDRVRQRTRELEEAQSQLMRNERVTALGMIGAGVAHELNNPMMGILNRIEYAIDQKPQDARLCDALRGALRDTQRCVGIVRDLLSFARQPRHEEYSAVEAGDLTAGVGNALQIADKDLVADGIEIEVDFAHHPLWTVLGEGTIREIVSNLIDNARDAMAGCPRRRLLLCTREEGDHAVLVIRDTGHGMDERTRQRALEPFFTTKPPGSGSGLGLALCDNLVKAAGGRIDVESTPGSGTTLTVVIPKAKEELVSMAQGAENANEEHTGY